MRKYLQKTIQKNKISKLMLQGCLHIIHEKKPCNDIIKLLKSGSHDKWEMTRHNSQQSGSRCDWSMTLLKHQNFTQIHCLHNIVWATASCGHLWNMKSRTLNGFSALNCSILNYVFKILDNLNFIVFLGQSSRQNFFFFNFVKRSLE